MGAIAHQGDAPQEGVADTVEGGWLDEEGEGNPHRRHAEVETSRAGDGREIHRIDVALAPALLVGSHVEMELPTHHLGTGSVIDQGEGSWKVKAHGPLSGPQGE